VLRAGRIEQVGTPLELYERPANLFVAGFIGMPPMNLVPGRLFGVEGEAVYGFRPEACTVSANGGGAAARIVAVEHFGATVQIHAEVGGTIVRALASARQQEWRPGMAVYLQPDRSRELFFDPASGRAI
jgi:multiple sugar transport system ATP-binding protein